MTNEGRLITIRQTGRLPMVIPKFELDPWLASLRVNVVFLNVFWRALSENYLRSHSVCKLHSQGVAATRPIAKYSLFKLFKLNGTGS
jgi:hypothetical protein